MMEDVTLRELLVAIGAIVLGWLARFIQVKAGPRR